MRFIIIGAAGFIGHELSRYLLERDHEVIGYDLLPEPIHAIDHEKMTYKQLGEVSAEDYRAADCLVLLAAKRPYKEFCFADYQSNVAIVEQYCAAAMRYGLTNIVFASSKAVYSGEKMPWSESERAVPSGLYGASKLAGEDIGLFYSKYAGLRFKSLRFAQIIGMGERKGYLINTLIDNAIEKKSQTIYGSGEQTRHYVYVKDVCGAILTAAGRADTYGVYNIGMDKAVSNLELAECVNRVFDNEGNLYHDYSKEMVGSNDEMSIILAQRELGFIAQYDLEATFKDLAATVNHG